MSDGNIIISSIYKFFINSFAKNKYGMVKIEDYGNNNSPAYAPGPKNRSMERIGKNSSFTSQNGFIENSSGRFEFLAIA